MDSTSNSLATVISGTIEEVLRQVNYQKEVDWFDTEDELKKKKNKIMNKIKIWMCK